MRCRSGVGQIHRAECVSQWLSAVVQEAAAALIVLRRVSFGTMVHASVIGLAPVSVLFSLKERACVCPAQLLLIGCRKDPC